MRKPERPAHPARLGLLLLTPLLFSFSAAWAAGHVAPPVPEPPEPPSPPEVSMSGISVPKGQTHKGNIMRFAPSADIAGTLDGDLWATASSVEISGTVTGDVFVASSTVDVSGDVKKSFRAAAASTVINGTIEGNLVVYGDSFTLGENAHIHGSVSAFTREMVNHGTIDGSLTFTGGVARLAGKVEENGTITADTIEIEPNARVEGDVTYSTRHRMDSELKAITGGEVTYDANAVKEKKIKRHEEPSLGPSKFGIGIRIAFFTASFLFGCALLALFRDHEPKVTAAIQADTLRCVGVGFVSVLVTIAVCLSMILIITIPFVLIYLVAYVIAAYLAKIPVAIWLGRFVLAKINRPAGVFVTLFVGLALLYLLFMIPVLWILVEIGATLLGLGAMTTTYLAYRQARKTPLAPPPTEASPAPAV